MAETRPPGAGAPRFLSDWGLYRSFYTDEDIAAAASEEACIAAWLRFEQAVARAQAALGLVPADAAEAIGSLSAADIDYAMLVAETRTVGRPILPLVDAMRRALPAPHRAFVHRGLTTQDVMDSGHALLLRDGASAVDRRLEALLGRLAGIARAHAETPMLGRTIGQAARPTTFGFRVAVWVAEVGRHRRRVAAAAADAATVQFGGAVGTLAGQGGRGRELRARVAAELGLAAAPITTQSARDGVVAFLLALAGLGASVEKIARELAFLAATGIGEIRFRQPPGTGVSSAMPHKANPSRLEFAEACGGLAKTRGASALDAAAHRGDREGGVWLREWPTLIETLHYGASALRHLDDAVAVLEVDGAAMRRALDALPADVRSGDDVASAAAEARAALDEIAGGCDS
jgi:3-carboxy-cis,cis-muconate cycloisomerase